MGVTPLWPDMPRLLDLFCGAGGGSVGYRRAGFEVIGVDVKPQPRYPFHFVRFGWRQPLSDVSLEFDAIHASPPCQAYSTQTADRSRHPRLIEPLRELLEATGLPYVIENVPSAPLRAPRLLCGSAFRRNIRRHRHFETNWPLEGAQCHHSWQKPRFRSLDHSMVKRGRLASVVGVHGHINYPGEFEIRCQAMGIDWMTNNELVEAIPPIYTEWVGLQLRDYLRKLEEVTPSTTGKRLLRSDGKFEDCLADCGENGLYCCDGMWDDLRRASV